MKKNSNQGVVIKKENRQKRQILDLTCRPTQRDRDNEDPSILNIINHIKELVAANLYGELIVKFKNGRPVLIHTNRCDRPEDLPKIYRG